MNSNFSSRNVWIILLVILSALLLFGADKDAVWLHITSLIVLSVGAFVIVKGEITHPYAWYSLFFMMYAISYPLLYYTNQTVSFGYSHELVKTQWVALASFLLIVNPNKVEKKKFNFKYQINNIDRIITILCIIITVTSFVFSVSGISHKNEIYEMNNLFYNAVFRFAIIVCIFMVYKIMFMNEMFNTIDYKTIVKVGLALFLLTIFTGERDIIFRYVLAVFLVLYTIGYIKKRSFVIIIPIGMMLIYFSSVYKYFFLTGEKLDVANSGYTWWSFIFQSELISSSRNMQILLNNKSLVEGYFNGFSIFNDFKRIFVSTNFTHGTWFSGNFLASPNSKYGSTIVGQGYVNFGYIGIVAIFIFLGAIINFLYRYSYKNHYFFLIYLFTIPLYVYSIRADLANIFSPLIKHVLIGILLIVILEKLSKRKYRMERLNEK